MPSSVVVPVEATGEPGHAEFCDDKFVDVLCHASGLLKKMPCF